MVNLRELEFIGCPKCLARWSETRVMGLMQFLGSRLVPKTVLVRGAFGESLPTYLSEGLRAARFVEPENFGSNDDLWSCLENGALLSLDMTV